MTNEVRTHYEGALYWIRASGVDDGTWQTASGAQGVSSSGAVGYVDAGMQYQSAQTIATIMDRGIPKHHKYQDRQPIEVTFTFKEAITANNPALLLSGIAGASVSMMNFELKHSMDELGGGTAQYTRFHMGTLIDDNWTEGEEGNAKSQTWRFLSMTGPVTGSGYLG